MIVRMMEVMKILDVEMKREYVQVDSHQIVILYYPFDCLQSP